MTPSWHKGKNPCQDSSSSHRKTAFIGTRPDINSSELGTAFKALLSLASNMSPSEQAERVHYHFLNLRGKQSSNIVFTAIRRKNFLFPDRTCIRPVVICIAKGEKSILYMHILGFLETFFVTPMSHLQPMDITQLSFSVVVSTSVPSQEEQDGGLCFLYVETDLLPFLLISEGFMGWLFFSLKYTHMCSETACNFPGKNILKKGCLP